MRGIGSGASGRGGGVYDESCGRRAPWSSQVPALQEGGTGTAV